MLKKNIPNWMAAPMLVCMVVVVGYEIFIETHNKAVKEFISNYHLYVRNEISVGHGLPDPDIYINGKTASVSGHITPALTHTLQQTNGLTKLTVSSKGGYISLLGTVARLAKNIIVAGECHSACPMLLLGYDNVCVDETVTTKLRFHTIVTNWVRDGKRLANREKTVRFLMTLRPVLQVKLAELISPYSTFVSVPINEFLEIYPEKSCSVLLAREGVVEGKL